MSRARRARSFVAGAAILMSLTWSAALGAERMIEAPGPSGPLQGTLLLAQPDAPVVIIVPGSGPTDRDGNNPLGVSASSYRLLAETLARKGISSLRIDKRGMFASRRAIPDPNAVTIADYAADVRAWVAKARAETGASCVWIAGHSEGGLVALAAADDEHICGLVLIATAGLRTGDLLREQLRANAANAPILEQALAAISALEQGGNVDATRLDPALATLFHPAVQGFLRDAMSYDPAALIAKVAKPVLIVQGTRDMQVSENDARLLKAAAPRAELILLPDVNHVLKAVASDDRAANLATYAAPRLPIAGSVVDAIAAFIQNHAKR